MVCPLNYLFVNGRVLRSAGSDKGSVGEGGGGEVGRERVTASGLLLFDFSRTSR